MFVENPLASFKVPPNITVNHRIATIDKGDYQEWNDKRPPSKPP